MSDGNGVMGSLARMQSRSAKARVQRLVNRLLSPKRVVASLVAFAFLSLYIANGVLILWTRKPVAIESLAPWLCGSMAIYAIFHFVRASWQEPEARLGLSPAESLWLGRAPLPNHQLVLYRLTSIVPSTFVKTLLVATVLLCDVASPVRLIIGLLFAMLTLEAIRIIADRIMSSLSRRELWFARAAFSTIAIALIVQLIARTIAAASDSVHPLSLLLAFTQALGETTRCGTVQWVAVPWWSMVELATAPAWTLSLLGQFAIMLATLASVVFLVIRADFWGTEHHNSCERQRLLKMQFDRSQVASRLDRAAKRLRLSSIIPSWRGVGPLVARQWVAVKRYRATILFSLAVPVGLSLAPLMTSSQAGMLHVSAWLAVCTLLLAPPALRIDFRRDIDRMWLLKSLPITPLAMTIGQILLPSLITIVFQACAIGIACLLTPTPTTTIILVLGGLSGLAVFSFAFENSLFLTFPHRPKQEGLAMMVRTKLVFLGKGLLLGVLGGTFMAWVTLCIELQWPMVVLIAGCITAAWLGAACAVVVTARCWRRFDMRLDSPIAH